MHDFEPSTVIDKLNTKAYKWAQVVGHLPKVVAVFLSGSIAQGRGDQNSDIDFEENHFRPFRFETLPL